MDNSQTIEALSALAQATRLEAFKLLVKFAVDGVPAGEIARLLEVPHNTMSAHLSVLSRAGLIRSEKQSRSVIYYPELERVREVVSFLLKDCCAGHPQICTPLMSDLVPCCDPKEKQRV